MSKLRSKSFVKTNININVNSNRDEKVSIEFIICLILYCNYYKIRYEFVNTYRRGLHRNGINAEKNHSIFANMGRILTVNINLFGNDWD